ncbi:MAG: InlB B-repeat-containing protein, partial [Bacteroidota bacterium]
MKKITILIVMLVAFTTFASAQTCTADQQVTGTDTRGASINSARVIGQSFPIWQTGWLNQISLDISASNPGCVQTTMDVKIAILNGNGIGGTQLASQIYTIPVDINRKFETFAFDIPAAVTGGSMYTIVVSLVSGQTCGSAEPNMYWYYQFPSYYWNSTGGTQYVGADVNSYGNTQYFKTCVGTCYGNIQFADAAFKSALLAIPSIDANSDGEIDCSEASSYSGTIDVSGKSISNVTELKFFTAITELNCSNNNISSLNITANKALTNLNCSYNTISSVDLSANTTLTNLNCSNNTISSLNLSANTLLTNIYCVKNKISTLSLTNNTALTTLNCDSNSISFLNLTANTALTTLYCSANNISYLNLSTNNTLTSLACNNNSLNTLNVKNSNNSNFTSFSVQNNSDLSCIQVDDSTYSTINWTNIDAGVVFMSLSECPACIVNIPDANFLSALIANGADINGSGYIDCFEASSYSGYLDLNSKDISDLTGIEAFTSLTQLDCFNNNFSSLDLTHNTSLTFLNCSNIDNLTSINISGLTSLSTLYCYNNSLLTTVNVSGCTSLSDFQCSNSSITNLDLSACSFLYYLDCSSNSLVSLNVKNGNNYNMYDFYAFDNPSLTCIEVDDVDFSYSNWWGKDDVASYNVNCTPNITASVSPVSSGTITGAREYNTGEQVSLVATAETGYTFVNWTESGTPISTNTTYEFTATLDRTLVANFAINTYTLDYAAGTNGSITGTANQTVNYNANGTAVTAVPSTGYHFVDWSDASTTNPRTDLNVTGNIDVTANFAINTYTLDYAAGTNGSITGTASQTVNYNANGSQVTAVPSTGYHFVDWSDASTTNPRTDANVTANITVTANFAINTYTLDYAAGTNGTITGTANQTVNYGASGTAVTAVPNTGYHFLDWSDASTQNPRTDLNVTANISVTANYAINTFTLDYAAGTNGSITGTANQTVNYGANGTAVTAVPSTGYHFVDWSDASTQNPRTDLNVTANIDVTANFAINTFTLDYVAGTNGSISGTANQTVNYNANGTAVTA